MAKPEKSTAAERHAAGALGRPTPVKPAGMSTAQFHVERFNARGARPAEPDPEPESEEKPLPEWAAKQVRAARNYRSFLAQELAKVAGTDGPGAA